LALHRDDRDDTGSSRAQTSPTWTGEVRFLPERLAEPLKRRKPTVYFNSMCDLFHEAVTNEQIAAVFGVMAACPQHQFIVSTKRYQRCAGWFGWLNDFAGEFDCQVARCWAYTLRLGRHSDHSWPPGQRPWPLPNVTLLFSASTQAEVDIAAPILLEVPAAKRGLILEPLLEPVVLRQGLPVRCGCVEQYKGLNCPACHGTGRIQPRPAGLSWIVVGRETGPGARPCKPEWIRRVADDCHAAEVAVWVKDGAGDAELEKVRERPR
jgi:protein gp37